MKIKSLLIGMLACTALVGCSNEEDVLNGEQATGKESYLAVSVRNANVASRATDGGFEDGSEEENVVKNAVFYFFDAEKNAYIVSEDGTKSYLEPSLTMSEETETDNVEEISNKVMVIKNSKNVPPKYMVAVLNAPAALKKNLSLNKLEEEVGAYNGNAEDGFVMSNSVYMHNVTGLAVNASEISIENLGANEKEALDNPVNIYVERVAAKVRVLAEGESFNTGQEFGGKKVYAKILGWNVTNVKSQANLLKKINTSWTDTELGFSGWNDATNFRSYWADTEDTGETTHPHNWGALSNLISASNYYYENTGSQKSQLLVRAEFVDDKGESLKNTIAEWYGARYTFEDLKVAFANAVAGKIFIKSSADASTAESIKPADIDFFQAENTEADGKRHLCYAKLAASSASSGEKIFVNEKNEALTVAAVNEILKAVRPAKIWKAGGYYYFNIDHLDNAEGLVRNHVYEITINGINGLGTPVYEPEKIIIPEKPGTDESFISAQVNILSWKVVKQTVILE